MHLLLAVGPRSLSCTLTARSLHSCRSATLPPRTAGRHDLGEQPLRRRQFSPPGLRARPMRSSRDPSPGERSARCIGDEGAPRKQSPAGLPLVRRTAEGNLLRGTTRGAGRCGRWEGGRGRQINTVPVRRNPTATRRAVDADSLPKSKVLKRNQASGDLLRRELRPSTRGVLNAHPPETPG